MKNAKMCYYAIRAQVHDALTIKKELDCATFLLYAIRENRYHNMAKSIKKYAHIEHIFHRDGKVTCINEGKRYSTDKGTIKATAKTILIGMLHPNHKNDLNDLI